MTAVMLTEGIGKRSRTVLRVASSLLAILGIAMIPTSLFAQPSASNPASANIPAAPVALRPATVGQILHLSASGERRDVGGPPRQRAASSDSLWNGALIGAAIGAAALGTFAATLCYVHRERGGPSCVPDALRFTAIGGAIGLGTGIAIDVARSSSPMVRVTIAF
jgi:hypothetical protein